MYFLIALITLLFSNSSPSFCAEQKKITADFDKLLTAALTGNESAVKAFLKQQTVYPHNHPYIQQAYVKTPAKNIKKILAAHCDIAKIQQPLPHNYSDSQKKIITCITSGNKKLYTQLKKYILTLSDKKTIHFIAYHLIEFLYLQDDSDKHHQDITKCFEALIDKGYVFTSMPEYAILIYHNYHSIIEKMINHPHAPHSLVLWTLCAGLDQQNKYLIDQLITTHPDCIKNLMHSPLSFLIYEPGQSLLFKFLCKERREFIYKNNLVKYIQNVGTPAEKNDRLNFLFSYGMHIKPSKSLWFSYMLNYEKNKNNWRSCFQEIIQSNDSQKHLNFITHRTFTLYDRQLLHNLIQSCKKYHEEHLNNAHTESNRFLVTLLTACTFFAQNIYIKQEFKNFWMLMLGDTVRALGPDHSDLFYGMCTKDNEDLKKYIITECALYGMPPCQKITHYKDIVIQHTK